MYRLFINILLLALLAVSPAHAKRVGNLEASSGAYIDFTLAEEMGVPTGVVADITSTPSVGALYLATDGYDTGDCSVGTGASLVLCAYDGSQWVSQSQDSTLAALSKTLATSSTLVDTFIYDTANDSDGGAWRKRCQDLSWYNETLNTSTRGATREFPAVVLVVAETDTVTLYDATDPDVPMWMVFNANESGNAIFGGGGNPLTSIEMMNGELQVGANGSSGGLSYINYLKDETGIRSTDTTRYWSRNVLDRNVVYSNTDPGYWVGIVNSKVNSTTMTVLPDAPVDQVTGLPVPTIAVATDGGVSVIDGPAGVDTVVDITWTNTTWGFAHSVAFRDDGALQIISGSVADKGFNHVLHVLPSVDVVLAANSYNKGTADEFYSYGSAADVDLVYLGEASEITVVSSEMHVLGSNLGLTLLKENPISPADGMVAYLTSSYFSGWMKGDIKLATLADSVAGDIVDLIINGDFPTDTANWVPYSSATLSVDTQRLKVLNVGATNGGASQAITTEVGEKYSAKVDITLVGGASCQLRAGTAPGLFDVGIVTSGTGTAYVSFTAIGTTTYITVVNADAVDTVYNFFDNIIVSEAIEDRSVNDNPLQVVGTITKTPVATGSELMAYSGFSVTDYIEQPYNSDLDFGTGDFYIMGWLETSQGSGTVEYMFERAKSGSATNYLYIRRSSSSGNLGVGMAGMTAIEVPGILKNAVPQLILVYVKSNTLYVFVDGIQVASAATTGSMTIVDAIVRLGVRAYSVSSPGIYQSLTLWRIGAGSLSDEQIKDIYEMEKKLFEEGAEYLLSADSVANLSYDPVTEKLTVLTDKVEEFQGLLRLSSSTPTGTPVAVSTINDKQLLVTSSQVSYESPGYNLMEEMERKEILSSGLVEWDYSSATEFKIPLGYYPEDVYNSTSKYARSDVTITFDGYNYWCTISSASAVYITGSRIH